MYRHMENVLTEYQCPPLTVLVDDSRSFLDSLAFQFSPQVECKDFYDTQPALARQPSRIPCA